MTSTSREALVVFAENVDKVNSAVESMNSSLENHGELINASTEVKNKLEMLSEAILSNDKKLMISLSKEISNLSSGISKSIKVDQPC